VSTYRDDLEAAQARADAAQDEAERLRKEVDRLKKPGPAAAVEEPQIPIPERFNVTRTANELTVRWRWFRAQHVFMLFFAIAWDAFLVFWYFGPMAGQGGLLFQVFPIVHVAVGLGISYSVLTGFLNSTTIAVARGRLRVKHGPLPWRGNRVMSRDDVTQLFVRESKSTHRSRYSSDISIISRFDLLAVDADAREITLVRGLETPAQARYLEHAFEARLGILDKRVPGELPKDVGM
jgi:hypothetical protein